ncbi:MAG: insulinase family protein [Candidatus Komeilibacteria bacterium]|nr:insulinase family protein [Candidatus Komeilibacteria bacterium]
MHKRIVRPDGSVVMLVPRKESQSVTWEIMFKVGSRQESKKINGVSHFIEHLMFKGTTKRPTTKALSKELDAVGAEYNAFTSKDNTSYYIETASAHVELGIDMLSDMLRHSKFEKKEMERERGVIVEELNMYRDNPMMRIDEIFESTIYTGTSLGREIGGPRQVIKSVPHESLLAYKERFYYPGNMVIGVAGKFSEEKVLRLINRYLPVMKKKSKAQIQPITFSQSSPRSRFEYKETDQVQLMLGFPGYKRKHPKLDALMLLSVALGGTMSSRLFIQIRERKGLAYVIRSMVESYEDTGYLAVHAGVDKGKVEESLRAIRDELQKLTRSGVSRLELKQAKDNIRGRMILKFEKPSTYLSFLMSQELLTDRVQTLEERLATLDRVTLDDVNRVARNIIRWKLANLALIGPYKGASKFLKALV